MKTQRERAGFQPITLTIESEDELNQLYELAMYGYDESPAYSTSEKGGKLLMDAIRQYRN